MAISENLEKKFNKDFLNKNESIKPNTELFIKAFKKEIALLLKDANPLDAKHPDVVAEIQNWSEKIVGLEDRRKKIITQILNGTTDDYNDAKVA